MWVMKLLAEVSFGFSGVVLDDGGEKMKTVMRYDGKWWAFSQGSFIRNGGWDEDFNASNA